MTVLPFINKPDKPEFIQKLRESGTHLLLDQVSWPAFPYCPAASVYTAWTEKALLACFTVQEEEVRAIYSNTNDPVYEDSCVEWFIRPEMSAYYYNFEFNCLGTFLCGKRKLPQENIFYTKAALQSVQTISSLAAAGNSPPLKLSNTNWELGIVIPSILFGLEELSSGTRIDMNFHKCGDELKKPHYLSWKPYGGALPDFHQPHYFGNTILEK